MTKLMDNELKTVAGGDVRDIIDDSVSLYNAGYMGEKYDSVLYIITHYADQPEVPSGHYPDL